MSNACPNGRCFPDACICRRPGRREHWFPMITGEDAGGTREFVDDRPVHCGTALYLRAQKGHYDKDGTRWIDEPTDEYIAVRFEIAHPRKFVLDPVPCTHCKVVRLAPAVYRCGCKDEPTCCYCAGTGNMAGSIAFDRKGSWQDVRTRMLHVITATGGHEFTKEVHDAMQFRWPEERR